MTNERARELIGELLENADLDEVNEDDGEGLLRWVELASEAVRILRLLGAAKDSLLDSQEAPTLMAGEDSIEQIMKAGNAHTAWLKADRERVELWESQRNST